MAVAPVVGLEIGTSKTIALVGEMREDGYIMITGMGERPTAGVRKGEIVDIENAVATVRSVLSAAEDSSHVTISEVLLAVSGGHLQQSINRGSVRVMGENGEVGEDDILEVRDVAKTLSLPADREVLHTISQHYTIDNQTYVLKPEGMKAAQLTLDMLVLHGLRNPLNNAIKVAREVSLEVQDVAFSGLCSALSVLSPEQKKGGVIVIDLGGGTTDYVAYAEGIVAEAGALAVGGDHITNDISLAFDLPTSTAELLKREEGSTRMPAQAGQKVAIPSAVGFAGGMVTLNSLRDVVRVRVEETLTMVRKRLGPDLLHHVGAGVVLTGGGAHLAGITQTAEEIFGLPCSVGRPRNVSGLATASEGPEYATASGLVLYGFKTVRESGAGAGLTGWLKNIWRR